MVNSYLTKLAIRCSTVKTVYSINGVGKIGQIHAKKSMMNKIKILKIKWVILIFPCKGNQQNEKATPWMGEDVCQWYIQ